MLDCGGGFFDNRHSQFVKDAGTMIFMVDMFSHMFSCSLSRICFIVPSALSTPQCPALGVKGVF
jgi:hypothetical protein